MLGERFWCNSSGVGYALYYSVIIIVSKRCRNPMISNKSRILAVLLMVACTFRIGGEVAEKLGECSIAMR